MKFDEFEIVTEAAGMLRNFGKVELEPLTSTIMPGVGRTIPDLIFTPDKGPAQGIVHIIEFKSSTAEFVPSVFVANAAQHKRLIEESNPTMDVKFAFGSNATVLHKPQDMRTFDQITDATSLVKEVAAWSGVDPGVFKV